MADRTFITRAAVIGAGSMGAGIAAQLANSGVLVDLLDVPAPGTDPDARARAGIDRQLAERGFMSPDFADRVRPGNIGEHLDRLAEAEWIIEAVFEDIDVKRATFAGIAAHRAPGTPVSSNTSTIALSVLTEGMAADLRPDFAVIHFFNPPRIMPLVELVRGPDTSADTAAALTRICERQLGKVVIECRDTPGFIANRIGNFWLAVGATVALRDELSPELADATFGRPFGVPRTGVFGLFDHIGLQLIHPIWGSLHRALPEHDALHDHDITGADVVSRLLARGRTGRTSPEGAGFYRDRGREVFDPATDEYRPRTTPVDPALDERDPRALMEHDSPAGRYAREVFLETLRYCCDTAPGIADTVAAVDEAMVLGYAWKRGPFALADAIGTDWLLKAYGAEPPALLRAAARAGGFYPEPGSVLSTAGGVTELPRREGVVTVAELTRGAEVIFADSGAQVFRLDDATAVLVLRTRLNSLDESALAALSAAAGLSDIRALVVANDESRAFSAGADLKVLSAAFASGETTRFRGLIRAGAEALEKLRRAPFPVVAAVRGVALGGGLELALHCNASVIHAESRLGFPEPDVGIIPAWGGTVRVLENLIDNGVEQPHRAALDLIMSTTRVTPHTAMAQGWLRPGADRIVLSAGHVIADALDLARELADSGFTDPGTRQLPLYPAAAPALEFTGGSATDLRISRALAAVYTARADDGPTLDSFELGERETGATVELMGHRENVERAL